MTRTRLALEGIRILDFTRYLSGPVATMLMADMGADVIKVEHPKGDDLRGLHPVLPDGRSAAFLWANRNKRSIALDLHEPQAQQVARELATHADVVIENFLPRTMQRYGLAYEDLRAIKPDLVYCSVTAFGSDGSHAQRAGYDQIAQAESGFFSLNGDPDGAPYKAGAPVMDVSTGMMACNAILGALLARERGCGGQRVEVSLFDTAVFMTGHFAMNHLVTGKEQHRYGNGSPAAEPTGLFSGSDGQFYLSCVSDRNFEKLACDVLCRPHLLQDERFATAPARRRHRDALHSEIASTFALLPREHWLDRALKAGVPMGLVRSMSEALASPLAVERGLVSQAPSSSGGTVPNIAAPLRMHGTPLRAPMGAPLVGEHTDEILRELLGHEAAIVGAPAA
ncbi:MAG TPA: CoA transferase [Ramlibacter sp.]|nr:CoA transferase [Ramlibacter sp.]